MRYSEAFVVALKTRTDWWLGFCALTLFAALASVHSISYSPEHRVVVFAKPKIGQLAYDVEVANLGGRITTAFGVQRVKAEEFSYWLIEASERQGISPGCFSKLSFD